MTIKIGIWFVPVILTAFCLGMMFRPYRSSGDWDFSVIFRVLWIVPIAILWAVYFGLMLWLK